MIHTDTSETVLSSLPFSSLIAIRRCLCEDGARRYVRITGLPDTVFSTPAATKVRGRTVSGYVTSISPTDPNLSGDCPLFIAGGKNRHLIPGEYLRILRREYRRAHCWSNPPSTELWNSAHHDYY